MSAHHRIHHDGDQGGHAQVYRIWGQDALRVRRRTPPSGLVGGGGCV